MLYNTCVAFHLILCSSSHYKYVCYLIVRVFRKDAEVIINKELRSGSNYVIVKVCCHMRVFGACRKKHVASFSQTDRQLSVRRQGCQTEKETDTELLACLKL